MQSCTADATTVLASPDDDDDDDDDDDAEAARAILSKAPTSMTYIVAASRADMVEFSKRPKRASTTGGYERLLLFQKKRFRIDSSELVGRLFVVTIHVDVHGDQGERVGVA